MNRKLYKTKFDSRAIVIHTPEDFEGMRRAGHLSASCLDMITDYVDVGVSTERLDDLIAQFFSDHGAVSATLGYRGYPKNSCISLNEVVCHGIPSPDTILKERDVLNIDVTCILDGWYGDTSRMYIAGQRQGGKTSGTRKKLIDVTYDCLMDAIALIKPGVHLGDLGASIVKKARANRFSVVEDFVGHGIGQEFHMAPNVMHYGRKGEGVELREGMIFTVEPMINVGVKESDIDENDGWTARTLDRKTSAQFEHTVGVTAQGVEIFTLSPKGYTKPPYEHKSSSQG